MADISREWICGHWNARNLIAYISFTITSGKEDLPTKCLKCGYIAFPPGVICPKCWSEELDWVDLPQRAKVVTFTETQAGAPIGFPPPIILAWLDFGKDAPLNHLLVRIVNCAEGELKEGDEVKFVVYDVPAHPIEVKKDTKICDRIYYAFERVK